MKQDSTGMKKVLRLRRQTEKMLTKSASSLKKMSATEIRNLLEDLQIHLLELERQNEALVRVQQELKQAVETLRQSESRYRALFHESREAKSLAKNGRIIEVNAKWLELHGFEDEKEVLGKDVLQFIHEKDRNMLEDRRKRWPENLEAVYEIRDVRRDGSIIDVEVYSSAISLGGEIAILATLHDISDRRRLEKQTRRMKKLEAMATLTGGIAQHFNNALSAMITQTEILEMNFSDSEGIMRCVRPMKQATDRMAELTARLLASGFGGRYYPRPVRIGDSVKSVLSAIRPDIPDAVKLIFESAPDLPKVTGDPYQIGMAVSAVIENAVEAVETDGCVRISCYMETSRAAGPDDGPNPARGPYVCLSIEDDGKGMDPETLEKVYDPFFTTHVAGRGLGLSAAYGIARNHGGFISIASEPGRGTSVRICFPVGDL